jgi:predicted transcriptional regulator of viral defense system
MGDALARDVLWGVAVEQHGFVTAAQAKALEVSQGALSMLVARGTLERASHGVYRFAKLPASDADIYQLAVLWTGVPETCLSHETALAVYELGDVNPNVIHLTVPPGRRVRRQQGGEYAVHREVLAPKQVGWWEQIPTVTAATAIGQCIRYGTPTYLLRQSIDAAAHEGRIRAAEAEQLTQTLESRYE